MNVALWKFLSHAQILAILYLILLIWNFKNPNSNLPAHVLCEPPLVHKIPIHWGLVGP